VIDPIDSFQYEFILRIAEVGKCSPKTGSRLS
jgi:hypothetical protein